jgi:hypothetical protein
VDFVFSAQYLRTGTAGYSGNGMRQVPLSELPRPVSVQRGWASWDHRNAAAGPGRVISTYFRHDSLLLGFCVLYGVSILLVISSSTEEQRIPLFIWLDQIQVILFADLTCMTLFGVILRSQAPASMA